MVCCKLVAHPADEAATLSAVADLRPAPSAASDRPRNRSARHASFVAAVGRVLCRLEPASTKVAAFDRKDSEATPAIDAGRREGGERSPGRRCRGQREPAQHRRITGTSPGGREHQFKASVELQIDQPDPAQDTLAIDPCERSIGHGCKNLNVVRPADARLISRQGYPHGQAVTLEIPRKRAHAARVQRSAADGGG